MDVEAFQSVKWEELGYGVISSDLMESVAGPLEDFFTRYTREELTKQSLARRILLFPVATPSELTRHPQLEARGYFADVLHPELGVSVPYPGAFVKSGDGRDVVDFRRRPPLVGEHNMEVYQGELGLDAGRNRRPAPARSHLMINKGDGEDNGGGNGPRPLEGVNVLDFCWVAVGPMTTKYLAEFGATVVRVESAKRPGALRGAAPFKDGVPGINRSAYFASYNANKLGVAIDMRHPRARDLMLRMAGWANLVTENFTPGTMKGWGLGFDALSQVNPGLVMFSTSMMGTGRAPWNGNRGSDQCYRRWLGLPISPVGPTGCP